MEKEIWKDIIGYEGLYQISNLGRVKSVLRKTCLTPYKILKSHLSRNRGYLSIRLRINGIKKMYLIHRLLAIHFIPNPENKPHINHINGVKHDNSIENLEWCTHQENMQHSFRIGLNKNSDKAKASLIDRNKKRTGSNHHMSKLVLNTQTGIYYDSLSEASLTCNIPASTLYEKLRIRKQNNTNFIYV